MTMMQLLTPSTQRRATAARRALRAPSVMLCAIGLLGVAACGDSTGNDVIQSSPRSGSTVDRPEVTRGSSGTGATDDPTTSVGATRGSGADESGIDQEDEIAARSGGTRSSGGGGSRRSRDTDDEEIVSDAGVVDAGDAGIVLEDGGVIVEDGGVVVEDGGVEADAG